MSAVPAGKRRAYATILLTTSVLITAAVAEMGLRWRARGRVGAAAHAAAQAQDPERELSHAERLRPSSFPDVIYELKLGLDGLFLGQRLRTNAHGLRGEAVALAKPPGSRRLVGLGDSHMFGWGVAQDEVYLARLPLLLEASGSCRWQALNFAVPGYNTAMEVATFEHRALVFEPDLAVLHFVGNDEALPHFLDPNAPPEAPRSFLWDLLRRPFVTRPGEIGDGEGDEDEEGEEDEAGEERRRRRRDERPGQLAARGRYDHLAGEGPFAAAMDRLGALTRDRRIPVLVVALGHARRRPLQEAIRRNGFEFLDLSVRLHRHLVESGMPDDKSTWTRTYRIPGDGHPNPLAHRLYAEAIAERVRSLATQAFGDCQASTSTLKPP